MTMDEKIAFWRWVMQYARDRGIHLYVFTWNIFVYGTEPSGYGITDSASNATTTDYFRKSVRTLFNTYPLLAGVGLTVGENMGGISSAAEEQWAWDTYGLGVSDAMADAENPASPYYAPGRVIRLVHRAHQADLNQIISYFLPLPGATNADSTLAFSFKYSQAHMHSSTKPQFIYQNNWFNTIPAGKKIYLTVRNDDMYYMRWGDPDFARAYMTNLPDLSKIAGFYMGPDGYTWGREYLSTEPESPRQLVIEKMWYSFLLYGRLAYEPTLPNGRFEAILAERFPGVTSSNLFQGWASVSKILPLLTRFYWGALDFQWYPEACWSSSGFKTVQSFIDPQWDPMQSGEDGDRPLLMSVKQFVNGDAASGRLNPLQVADQLQQHADSGLLSVQALSPGANKELRLTLGDIHMMAWLGRYYAEKIRGAVDLYRYQINGLASDHANARTHLITASNHWSQYSARWSTQYVQQVLTRMGLTTVDIAGIQTKVNADIPAPLTPPGPTFTLTTSATNGSITLNPTGGVYTTGTVVTVTAIPNSGFAFGSWSGDLTGSANPATITMNGNKSVTATFNVLPPGSQIVLLVVGDTNNMTNGTSDLAIRNHLQSKGYIVQATNDESATNANATGKALVLTSATVAGGTLGAKFRDVAVPVINWEYNVQDDFGFTTGAGLGTAGLQTKLNITYPGHPLAGGLSSGPHTVATNAGDFAWGEPGGSPIIIARLNDGSHPCLYAYEAGAPMNGGTAPARRVHLFLQNNTFASLNSDGLSLFDAAVGWAIGQAGPSWFHPPVLQDGQLKLEWVGGGTLQSATNLPGSWTDVSGASSPYLAPTTNSAQFFRVKQ